MREGDRDWDGRGGVYIEDGAGGREKVRDQDSKEEKKHVYQESDRRGGCGPDSGRRERESPRGTAGQWIGRDARHGLERMGKSTNSHNYTPLRLRP